MDKVYIRASGLAELFDCPARWKAKHIDKIYSPSSGKAQRGTAIHLGTSIFDEGRIAGNTVSIEDAIDITHDAIYDKEIDVDWNDISRDDAFATAVPALINYCTEISPQYEFTHVELRCESVEVNCGDITLVLTGTTDRVYKVGDRYGVGDIKTGERAVDSEGETDTAGHKIQLSVYNLLAAMTLEQNMDLPALIFALKPHSENSTFAVGKSTASTEYLIGTQEEKGILEYAAGIIKSGNFYGNSKSFICNKSFCPVFNQCKFR